MAALILFLRENAPWLAAGFLLTFASSFGQTFFISVFAGEIRQTFGLSHGQWGGVYTLATTSSAIVMVFAGGLTDRFRVRIIGVAILLGLMATTFAMSVVQNVTLLILAIFLLRLFGQGMMSHTVMIAMARWFVARRGRAVSIAALGNATGEALLPITFVALLGVFDWRMLWIAAAMVLLALIPVLMALLRRERTPQSFATEEGAFGIGGRMWQRKDVLRHPVFWLMVPALLGPAAWGTSFFFHQVHTAEVKGWTHFSMVAIFPMFTASSIAFILIAGALVDRIGSARLAALYLLPMVLGFAIFPLAPTPGIGIVALVLMGAAQGMSNTLTSTFWAESFGTLHLGSIRAMIAAVTVLGTALGPGISGVLIDLGISFVQQCYGIAVYFLLAGMLAALAGRIVLRDRLASST